jgi:spermidine synthase
MVPAARIFDDFNDHVLDDERVKVSFNDARNELEFSPRGYDVLISEPSNPWMTIAANLFTEEFFRMAKTRIKPGGIFCQWVQNYYMPSEDMRSIIAAFRDSFPHILLFETTGGVDLLMLGSQEPLRMDLAKLDGRMEDLRIRMDLGRVRISTPVELLASFRLGDAEIDRLVAGAARNTDDNARVEFSAPKSLGLYTIDDNITMLRTFNADPLDYLDPPPTPEQIDALRLAFAAVWVSRGNKDLAEDALRQVAEGPLAAAADELMLQIRDR